MKGRPLFNTCPDSEFFGRESEMERISRRATEPGAAPSIFLTGRRWMGRTEVLRRVCRSLFWGQARVAPVYYQFKGYGGAEDFAEDFLKKTLKQYLAFRTRDPRTATSELSTDKLERLLIDNDLFEASGLVALHREAKKSGDAVACLRNALAAPQELTLRYGIPVYLAFDDVDLASGVGIHGSPAGLKKELFESLSGAFPFILSGSTKRALEGTLLNGSVETMELKGLDEDASASMMMELCRQHNVGFDPEILRLAANRLDGNPMYLKSMVWAAKKTDRGLDALKDFADLYAGEVFEGGIGTALSSSLRLGGLNDLRVAHACSGSARALSEEEIRERLRFTPQELREIIDGLSGSRVVEASLGSVEWAGDSPVRDFIYYVYETRIKGRSPEEVRTFVVRDVLKEGFGFKSSKIGVKLRDEAADIMRAFNNQKVPMVLFRNSAFSERFRHGSRALPEGEDGVVLPQTAGCFDALRWEAGESGPPILIAHGFQNGRYDSGSEVVWITAVKESSCPVNMGDVESFLRRSLILKENFRPARVLRWMVGKEGFTAEAARRLDNEGVYSSDSVQLRMIKDALEDGPAPARGAVKAAPVKEFEVVLPSASKAELVAARAVEEIGSEMGFDASAIGQIKAALVEACINAFEHSRVKSAKVFLRFVASSDRLTINVQNSGVDFDGPPEAPRNGGASGLPRKRGWGFELMKGLMDEVRFEKVRNGARIVLVKYLAGKGDGRDGQEV